MNKIKPLLKWVGGKRNLICKFSHLFPDKEEKFIYCEPFLGGASVLLWVLENYPNVSRVMVGDINENLISFYQSIQNYPLATYAHLKKLINLYIPLSEKSRTKFYYEIRDIFNSKTLGVFDKAAYFLFLNKTCYNGLYRENKKGQFNSPQGRYKNPSFPTLDHMSKFSELTKNVEFFCADYTSFNITDPESKYFFFLDPPHFVNKDSKFSKYHNSDFNRKNHIDLSYYCDYLDSFNVKFVLSNSFMSPEDIALLYPTYQYISFEARRAINRDSDKRLGKEIIIFN